MRKWFKYALGFLLVLLMVAFVSRERMTNYPSSIPPAKPERVLPPYGNILYTEGGEL